MRFLNLLLGLNSSVENGTVTTLTKDLLVERTLATLALGPEVTVLLFLLLQLLLSLDIDVLDAAFALVADDVLTG